jgi:hypothetical protein
VRPQILPALNYSQYSEEIINSKHTSQRRRLKAEKAVVDARVQTMVPALTNLQSIAKVGWRTMTSKALKGCYESSTKALGVLKDQILDDLERQGSVNIEKCPYCMLQSPSTWDHYFPQAHYPEFSIYHGNLVYVCSDCNHEKSDHYSEVQLEYLHPYFYGNVATVILFCKAHIRNGKLGFRFYSATADPAFAALAVIGQRHIVNLKLEIAFQSESSTVVSDFLSSIKEDFPQGISAEQLDRLVRKNYRMVESAYGPNAWEARLWHAIVSFAEFHDYVSVQLPLLPVRHRDGIDQIAPAPPN